MKDIQIVNIDYSAASTAYRKTEKHVLKDIPAPWLVPDEGPFYTDGIRLYNAGTPLIRDKDYTFDTPAPDLSEKTGRDVYLYILLSEDLVSSATAIDIEYQKVGDPMIGRSKLLEMLEEMVIDGTPIDFTTSVIGIPKTLPPSKHSMDVTNPDEVIGFGNLIQLFAILGSRVQGNGQQVIDLLEKLEEGFFQKLSYLQNLQWNAIMNHATKAPNPHGIKPADVQLGNLANNKTATIQQELEGTRSDLYSTPRGFKEIIKDAEPDSEEYVFQNELPFSYYGSGIYLPPPISGSFEGLGGDMENGCFIQEGNGWVVGLQRCFDGRVRNLYYIYNQSLPDDPGAGGWRQSYVQYKHQTIMSAGCEANFVYNGSGHDVLMLGDNVRRRWWICDPNSSLDPAQHQFKEVDMTDVNTIQDGQYRYGHSTVFRLGAYFFLMVFSNEDAPTDSNRVGNLFRVPIADVINPNIAKAKFTRVNLTYDNLRRQRLVNQPTFILDDWDRNPTTLKFTGGMGVRFSVPANNILSHRRRMFITCPSITEPGKMSIRIGWIVWVNYTFGSASRSVERRFMADYIFDMNTMTMTLNPAWKYIDFDLVNNSLPNLNDAELRRQSLDYAPGLKANLTNGSTIPTYSRVPGYGVLALCSHQDGGAPYVVMKVFENQSRDPARDYEYSLLPFNMPYLARGNNDGISYLVPDTPFGYTSYPRWYSDLYYYNGAQKTTPLELFMADSPGVDATWYYRESEPGDGSRYIRRDEVTLLTGENPWMREMNNKFGKSNIRQGEVARINNPKSKDKYSTEYGYVCIKWRSRKGGFPPLISPVIMPDGSVQRPTIDSNGGIIIPLLCDHRVIDGEMSIKAIPTESAYLSAYIWRDWVNRLIGAEINNVLDVVLDIWLSPKPDGVSGRRHSYAVVTFHTTDAPTAIRQIISKFTWSTASRVREAMVVGISSEQYPFISVYNGKALKPGNDNYLIPAGGADTQHAADGTWGIIEYGALTTSSMQVLEAKEHGVDNFSLKAYTGWRLQTSGYSRVFCFEDGYDPGYYQDGTVSHSPVTGSFVGYNSYKVANPDYGFCTGLNMMSVGGGAMNLVQTPSSGQLLIGATFSVGNWSVFINSEVGVTFNGYSMNAEKRNFDLRDFSEEYREAVFYIYCVSRGSKAEYELTKMLRHNRADSLLICKITTSNQGIQLIERFQPFSISGAPLTAVRQAGIPHTSGNLLEAGSYPHIKRSELYNG